MANNLQTLSFGWGSRATTSVGKGGYFFLCMAVIFLLIVLIGFARTLYLRSFFDVPAIPYYLYIHGVLLTGWFALLVVQPFLIVTGRVAQHRRLGTFGAVYGLALIVATFIAIVGAVRVHLGDGKPIEAVSRATWANLALLLSFCVLLGSAIILRRKPEAHKRLMLLASLSIISPALARFPNFLTFGHGQVFPFTVIALILVALVIYDLFSRKRVHLVSILGPVFIVLMVAGGRFLVSGTEFVQELVRALA